MHRVMCVEYAQHRCIDLFGLLLTLLGTPPVRPSSLALLAVKAFAC